MLLVPNQDASRCPPFSSAEDPQRESDFWFETPFFCIITHFDQSARTAAKTASDGQGGAGDKKDPPEVLDVIAIVRGLAAHKAPGLEYEVVSPTCIKIPARNAAALKRARTALKEAVGVDAIAAAKEQLKAAGAIVSWFLIEEGQAASLKTFERQAAQDLLPLFTVQLAAVEAVYSEFVNKDGILVKKTELQVQSWGLFLSSPSSISYPSVSLSLSVWSSRAPRVSLLSQGHAD